MADLTARNHRPPLVQIYARRLETLPGTAPELSMTTGMSTSENDMTWIEGGTFRMGSADFYPEEAPVHSVEVDGLWVDRQPVTVSDFTRFVEETGYVTLAERPPDPALFPGADPALLVPGSLVFQKAPQRVRLEDYRQWWAYVPGADWRHPAGPRSDLSGRDGHPVTHVAHEDAATYADWSGKSLPTEAEWEYVARGGLDQAVFAWGDEERPAGKLMANSWQGEFPWQNRGASGHEGTSPVGTFPPNGYGLYDVTGNVWEWTDDFFTPRHPADADKTCCVPRNPRVATATPGDPIPRRVIKGGSHLCAPNYCLRYRPAARQGEGVDTSTSHLGLRCVRRPPAEAGRIAVRASEAGVGR